MEPYRKNPTSIFILKHPYLKGRVEIVEVELTPICEEIKNPYQINHEEQVTANTQKIKKNRVNQNTILKNTSTEKKIKKQKNQYKEN